jgi:hypothetical protein
MTASNDVAVPLHSLSAVRDWMPDFHHIGIHALSSMSVVTDNGREPVIPYGTSLAALLWQLRPRLGPAVASNRHE